MTTSFITDQIDQELQLTELAQMNGAMPALIVAGLAVGGFAAGYFGAEAYYWFEENREKIADDVSEAVHDAISAEDDGGNVAPTGDGKGCTDRGLPF